MNEMAPYRHTEVVRVEECAACARQSRRSKALVVGLSAMILPVLQGLPWMAFPAVIIPLGKPEAVGSFAALFAMIGILAYPVTLARMLIAFSRAASATMSAPLEP